MKTTFILLLATVLTLGCQSPKDKHRAPEEESPSVDAAFVEPLSMDDSHVTETVAFQGKEYKLSIDRLSDESLPRVKGLDGDEFVDNRITLRVTAGAAHTLLNREFTRAAFADELQGEPVTAYRLEALTFDKATAAGLVFIVSLGYPQSDLFVPIRLVVDYSGRLSMSPGSLIDEEE